MLISSQTNLLYPELLFEITERLADRGYRLMLFTVGGGRSVADVVDTIWAHRVDAALATGIVEEGVAARFARHHVPLVLFNRVLESGVSSVYCDHRAGARSLVGSLLRAGRRSFAIVSGPETSFTGVETVAGATDRLRAEGIEEVVVIRRPYAYASAASAIAEAEAALQRIPDAFVCVNEAVALGCIDQLRIARSLRVPDDVSVVGFGGFSPTEWLNYQLTIMHQPVENMVSAAVDLLIARIDTPDLPAEHRVFFATLKPGRTARLA